MHAPSAEQQQWAEDAARMYMVRHRKDRIRSMWEYTRIIENAADGLFDMHEGDELARNRHHLLITLDQDRRIREWVVRKRVGTKAAWRWTLHKYYQILARGVEESELQAYRQQHAISLAEHRAGMLLLLRGDDPQAAE